VSAFAIMVDFRLKPGALPLFRPLIDANARASCADEPGCQRFDVLEPEGEPDRIVLYEIYDDGAAFEAHTRTAHFKSFDAESARHVARKLVTRLDLVCEGSARAKEGAPA
jgi:(4S)-4-hydroxy-5-phosphonooxypentane-2,3-dione isomerase